MPQQPFSASIAAGVTTNVLEGKVFQRLAGRPASVSLYMVTTTSTGGPDITATYLLGSDLIAMDLNPNERSEVNIDQDQVASGIGAAGDPITVNVHNAHATTARSVKGFVDIRYA